MAARNKPAGIRSLVYGIGKGKVRIEGLSVSRQPKTAEIYLPIYTRFMTPQTWLITGGAGYIGAHVADEFLANGKDVVIYDSLCRGLASRIEYLRRKHNKVIPLVVADIRDMDKFEEVLSIFKPYGIIHIAALKAVGESMEKPDEYFEVNHHATTKILEVITKHQIKNFIFSSTAAVYGAPDISNPVKEGDEKNPISPYGASKLAAEGEVVKFLGVPGNHGTSLRFFNVVGTGATELHDNSAENLVPIVIKKLRAGEPPVIYGTDYPTPDGTCIRDYVDVRDIAKAHLAVADSTAKIPFAMNVGRGLGTSVREVIAIVFELAGKNCLPVIELGRRKGDPALLLAETALIESKLKFKSTIPLKSSIQSLGIP
jgi:UDP-glucose 4-epimerase